MKLNHSFNVGLAPEETFDLLLDVPRIAHCMPGAKLATVDGDDFAGSVKVKLGPVVMTYDGKAKILERNRDALTARIELSGRDTKGSSDASATVDTVLVPSEGGTKVQLVTDLAVTGKPAQFGRGIMNDVGRKLIGQFATALAADIESTKIPPTAETPGLNADVRPTRRPDPTEPDPIDLLKVAGVPDKRLLVTAGIVIALVLLWIRCRGRN